VVRRFHADHDLVWHTRDLLELRDRRAGAEGTDSHTIAFHLLGQRLANSKSKALLAA